MRWYLPHNHIVRRSLKYTPERLFRSEHLSNSAHIFDLHMLTWFKKLILILRSIYWFNKFIPLYLLTEHNLVSLCLKDKNLMSLTGKVLMTCDLARRYGIRDIDGKFVLAFCFELV